MLALLEIILSNGTEEEQEIILSAIGLYPIKNFINIQFSLTHNEENLI